MQTYQNRPNAKSYSWYQEKKKNLNVFTCQSICKFTLFHILSLKYEHKERHAWTRLHTHKWAYILCRCTYMFSLSTSSLQLPSTSKTIQIRGSARHLTFFNCCYPGSNLTKMFEIVYFKYQFQQVRRQPILKVVVLL